MVLSVSQACTVERTSWPRSFLVVKTLLVQTSIVKTWYRCRSRCNGIAVYLRSSTLVPVRQPNCRPLHTLACRPTWHALVEVVPSRWTGREGRPRRRCAVVPAARWEDSRGPTEEQEGMSEGAPPRSSSAGVPGIRALPRPQLRTPCQRIGTRCTGACYAHRAEGSAQGA